MNGIDYLELTCPKELLERSVVELKTTPFYVKCLNKNIEKEENEPRL